MKLDRFFAGSEWWRADEVVLGADESHHCLRVMRKRAGDEIEVFDGAGRWGRGVIEGEDAAGVVVRLREEGRSAVPSPGIALAVGIPKGKTMELIVQKAVELGVSEIQPLVTEHTMVRVEGAEAKRKGEKWQRVALEACKQCGQNVLPAVHVPRRFEEWLASREAGRPGLVGSLAEGALPLREGIARLPERAAAVELLIGPEGDFTRGEVEAACAAGLVPVTLGEITLRVETAAMFCLSVLNYELRLE